MEKANFDSVVGRLERLERENSLLRRVGAVVILFAVALTFLGATRPAPKTLEAEKFILRDADGRMRSMLGFAEDGSPYLRFFDKQDKLRVETGIDEKVGPVEYLIGEDGKPWVTQTANKLGVGTVAVHGPGGETIQLDVVGAPDHQARIQMGREGRNDWVQIVSDPRKSQVAILKQDMMTERIQLGTDLDEKGAADLTIYDRNGKLLFKAPSN